MKTILQVIGRYLTPPRNNERDIREENRPELPTRKNTWSSCHEGVTLERVNSIPLYRSREVPEYLKCMAPRNSSGSRYRKIRVTTKLIGREDLTIANLKRELRYQLLSRGAEAGINYIRCVDKENNEMIGIAIPAKRI